MSSTEVLIDLIISAVYTIVIALTPYIICKFVRKNIDNKFAKKFTIIFSIVSFLIFLVVGFITKSKVTVNPAILWNFVGYLIIVPKKEKNTTPADFSNEPFFKIEKPTSVINEKLDTQTDTEMKCNVQEKATVSQKKSQKSKKDFKYKKSTVILSITTVIFIFSTVVLSGFLFFEHSENIKNSEQISDFKATIKENENSKEILRDRINTLEQELDEAYEKIRIYEGRPSLDEIQEKLKNDEDVEWN